MTSPPSMNVFSLDLLLDTAAVLFGIAIQMGVGFVIAYTWHFFDVTIARSTKDRRNLGLGLGMFLTAINAVVFMVLHGVWQDDPAYLSLLHSVWITWAAIVWLLVIAMVVIFTWAMVQAIRGKVKKQNDGGGDEGGDRPPEYSAVAAEDYELAEEGGSVGEGGSHGGHGTKETADRVEKPEPAP